MKSSYEHSPNKLHLSLILLLALLAAQTSALQHLKSIVDDSQGSTPTIKTRSLQECAAGSFLAAGSCSPCSELCSECVITSSYCTACPDPRYILDNHICKTQDQIREERLPTFRLILLLSVFAYSSIYITAQLLIWWDDYKFSAYMYK